MAVRAATRRYPDLPAFVTDYLSTLRVGALLLPAGTIDGEPSPEMKIDLVIPLVGRVGPIDAQVVQRLPDGGVALRIPEMPPAVEQAVKAARASIEATKTWLLETGQVALPNDALIAEIASLRARVLELETRPAPGPATVPVGGAAPVAASGPLERGYALPDVRGLAPQYQGRLGDDSLRDALMAVAVRKETGLLSLELPGGRRRWGFWSKGGAVGWRSEPVDEQEVLGVLLAKSNQISREQLAESLERMDRDNCRQGEALIEMGVFGFAQLVMLLQKQTEFVFQRVAALREGSWSFHVLPELPERFVVPPIRVASLLYRSLKLGAKQMAAEDLSNALRPMLDRYVFIRPGAERVLDEMRLSADEQHFVKILNSTSYRLREVFSVSNLSRSVTAYTTWCFAQLGLLEFRDEEARARVEDRVARLIESRKLAVNLNYFERMDLHWICTSPEVEAAWARIMPDFAMEKLAVYGEKYRPALEKINAAMREAYETLRDEHKRREYRASIIEAPMILQSATMLADKGDMAVMKETGREARECFAKAAELIPGNARFREGLQKAESLR